MSGAIDPSADGAQMDFKGSMSYGDYLGLDGLLSQQTCLSDAHDEMLFIIQHQTSELWMKLAIHELMAARNALQQGETAQMFKMLARVTRIFEQLNAAWDVLRTMTPADYTRFRAALGPSSGFQSHQYRLIEYILGNRNIHMMQPHAHVPQAHETLRAEVSRASLYEEVLRLLVCTLDGDLGAMPDLARDAPHKAIPAIQDRWQTVYEAPEQY